MLMQLVNFIVGKTAMEHPDRIGDNTNIPKVSKFSVKNGIYVNWIENVILVM